VKIPKENAASRTAPERTRSIRDCSDLAQAAKTRSQSKRMIFSSRAFAEHAIRPRGTPANPYNTTAKPGIRVVE